jgi:magnesium transporter
MDVDDAIDVLEELDEENRKEIVNLMEPEAKEDIQDIIKYDDDEIGSKMTNNYVSILVKASSC